VALDVRSDESVRSCVAQVVAKAGRLDVLVNNAGYSITGAAEETSVDEAKAQLETNFFGAVRMVNAVLPGMRAAGAGKVINSRWRGAYSRSSRSRIRDCATAWARKRPGCRGCGMSCRGTCTRRGCGRRSRCRGESSSAFVFPR